MPKSRLQRWLDAERLTSAALEEEIHMCRQSLTKIRAGTVDQRHSTMVRILRGCCNLAKRRVHIEEIFEFEPEGWGE